MLCDSILCGTLTNKKDQWPPVVGMGKEIIDKGVTVLGDDEIVL